VAPGVSGTNDPSVIAGRYEVLSKLGAGAFGTVYKAKDTMLGRILAIKTIRLEGLAAQGASFEELVRRFKAEARVSAQLKHPNIVTIYDIGEAQGMSYLAMEFIDGVGLDRVIAGAGRMPIERAAALAAQVADALDFAHRNQIVHRDVKPANIMIEAGDRVKVTDFGIAKVLDAAEQMTATGSLLGTPSYMSPEQARGAAVDGRSDLFAVGCIFYEMLTGQRAFRADSITGLIFKIITEDPKPIREIAPDLPEDVLALVDRALSKAPEARFQTGREMADSLLALTHAGVVPTLRGTDMSTTASGGVHPLAALPTMAGGAQTQQGTSRPPTEPTVVAPPPRPAPPPPPLPRPAAAPRAAAPAPSSSKLPIILAGAGGLVLLMGVALVGWLVLRPSKPTLPPTTIAAATPPPTTLTGTSREGLGSRVPGASPGTPVDTLPTAPPAADTPVATPTPGAATAPPGTQTAGIIPPPTVPQVTAPPETRTTDSGGNSFLDEDIADQDNGSAAGSRLAEAYRSGGGGGGGATFRSGPRTRYPKGLAGSERAAVLAMRHIVARQHDHYRASGSYGTLRDMGLSVSGNSFARKGYRFELKVAEDGYTLTAIPIGASGRPFTADDTGLIRAGVE
jgi:serine/threonine protein kinase